MGGKAIGTGRSGYFPKLRDLLSSHQSVLIVSIDNVSSQQMHEIREELRGKAIVLMGKNTMIRRALKTFAADNPEYERLLPYVSGNIGFVFTNQDLKRTREIIVSNAVAAPARAGAVAPLDVYINSGNTGMEPGKTSFFQALGVPTKIARGTIEITSDLKIVEAGTKVGPSEAVLLNMLNISPFTYSMRLLQIYDQKQTFAPAILDISTEQLLRTLTSTIYTVTAISLALTYPTLPSIMHSLINGYKKLLAITVQTDYAWEEISGLKDRVANPDKYLVSVEEKATTAPINSAPVEAHDVEAESEDEDMGFGLFD